MLKKYTHTHTHTHTHTKAKLLGNFVLFWLWPSVLYAIQKKGNKQDENTLPSLPGRAKADMSILKSCSKE